MNREMAFTAHCGSIAATYESQPTGNQYTGLKAASALYLNPPPTFTAPRQTASDYFRLKKARAVAGGTPGPKPSQVYGPVACLQNQC